MNRERRRVETRKAALCWRKARQRGVYQAATLIDALAEYGALSDNLAYPSQQTLAKDCGVTSRTIRRWTNQLEAIGVLQVYRSNPMRQSNGTYTRQTSRYLLCSRRAERMPATMPLRRRHLGATAISPPTGHQCPLTSTQSLEPESGAVNVGGAPEISGSKIVQTAEIEPSALELSKPAPVVEQSTGHPAELLVDPELIPLPITGEKADFSTVREAMAAARAALSQ